MSKTRDLAKKAFNYGKPVSGEFLTNEGVEPRNHGSMFNNWMKSDMYVCKKIIINGINHYHMIEIKQDPNEAARSSVDLVKMKRLVDEGLTLELIAKEMGFGKAKAGKIILKNGLRDKASKHSRVKKPHYKKKEIARGGIIHLMRSNPETRLWSIALGFNV